MKIVFYWKGSSPGQLPLISQLCDLGKSSYHGGNLVSFPLCRMVQLNQLYSFSYLKISMYAQQTISTVPFSSGNSLIYMCQMLGRAMLIFYIIYSMINVTFLIETHSTQPSAFTFFYLQKLDKRKRMPAIFQLADVRYGAFGQVKAY